MSSGVFLHFLSDKSLRWTFRSGGALVLLKGGVPKACLEFQSVEPVLVEDELEKYWSLHGPSSLDEYKIIGFPEFVSVAQKVLERSRRIVTKVVSRDSEFELFYDASYKKVQVTRTLPIATTQKKKIKVLIVDDSATIRQILAKVFLTDPHIEVIGSLANPLEVDSFIQKNKPDVMTLDIHMPEMDGVTPLPKEIPPILVVQHIPAVFSRALADRLNTICEFEVKEAEENDLVKKNQVLIAPGGKQLSVVRRAGELRVRLSDDAPVNRHKPSVDYLFDQVSTLECSHIVGIVLTGMGADGARGLKKLFDMGARTIAQDQSSSVVWGMPREAVAMGGAEFVLPLEQIAEKLMNLAQAEQAQRPAALKKKTS